MPRVPVVLTIAGSDSSGAAGLQADLPTLAEAGVRATCAVTVLTAQNGLGMRAVHHVDPLLVAAQIDAVLEAERPSATKTGLLGRSEVLEVIAERRDHLGLLVIDPVMAAGDGRVIVDADVIECYRSLAAGSAAFTPNLREVELLLGIDDPIDAQGAIAHADALRAMGSELVIVTGGRSTGAFVIDIEITFDAVRIVRHRRVGPERRAGEAVPGVRGTGDVFSAALAAGLAKGQNAADAAAAGRVLVRRRLETLARLGSIGPGRPGLPHHRASD